MAAYISVPRDLTKVKSKVAFNLTKRQLVCFGTAALIGVPLFFVLRDSGGNTAAIPLTQEEFAQKLADRNEIQSYRMKQFQQSGHDCYGLTFAACGRRT